MITSGKIIFQGQDGYSGPMGEKGLPGREGDRVRLPSRKRFVRR